jgi:hypothetical protein
MTELVWEEPPIQQRTLRFWGDVLEQLEGRPGEWAIVYRQNGDSAQAARKKALTLRRTAKRRGLTIETATRTADGLVNVYARRVP